MKNNFFKNIIYKISIILLLVTLSACDTWDENININPNTPNSVLESENQNDVDPSVF